MLLIFVLLVIAIGCVTAEWHIARPAIEAWGDHQEGSNYGGYSGENHIIDRTVKSALIVLLDRCYAVGLSIVILLRLVPAAILIGAIGFATSRKCFFLSQVAFEMP